MTPDNKLVNELAGRYAMDSHEIALLRSLIAEVRREAISETRKADAKFLEKQAESHGCQRCWADNSDLPCTCASEKSSLKNAATELLRLSQEVVKTAEPSGGK